MSYAVCRCNSDMQERNPNCPVHREQRSEEKRFNREPPLLDWTGIEGSPFEVVRVYPPTGTLIEIRECDLNVEGARALRDWLNKVLP